MTIKAIARVKELAAPSTTKELERRQAIWDSVTEVLTLLNMNGPKPPVQGKSFLTSTAYSDARDAAHGYSKFVMFVEPKGWKWKPAGRQPTWTMRDGGVKASLHVELISDAGKPCVEVELVWD